MLDSTVHDLSEVPLGGGVVYISQPTLARLTD